jgi:sugar/nucleoside kinase (ribokinase family)
VIAWYVISQVLDKLPSAVGVLVTAGSRGASYCLHCSGKQQITGFVPVYDVAVQDTTGAGDAFTCGFLAYVLAEVRIASSTYLALVCFAECA